MVFSSIVFLLYFLPVFLVIYYLTPGKLKNVILLLGSIFFYSWGAPKFIFVIIGTTLIDFYLVRWMDGSESSTKRRVLLTFSVCINLGLLFYFKYSNFFIENVNILLGAAGNDTVNWTKLILPIGISFYTFETLTYVLDVYRKVHKPLKNFWDYQLYIILFPKLIAGPIIRYHEIADQISNRSRNETLDNKLTGFFRFAIGLAKKVLIANSLGQQADIVFNANGDITTYAAWIGILSYTFQIYFDFSGYSDMAIGLGKMLGFKFPENFNNPYVSQSITEFWRRWHITLGKWMRNYLYVPLGGNRVSNERLYFNLWFVFLASGLWHGASWNFIIWGAYHGLFLVLERAGLSNFYKRIGKLPSVLITFFLVLNGWVFFRVENLADAIIFYKAMYAMDITGLKLLLNHEYWFVLMLAILFSFFTLPAIGERIQALIYFHTYSLERFILLTIVSIILFVISVGAIGSSAFNPFIYFRF